MKADENKIQENSPVYLRQLAFFHNFQQRPLILLHYTIDHCKENSCSHTNTNRITQDFQFAFRFKAKYSVDFAIRQCVISNEVERKIHRM